MRYLLIYTADPDLDSQWGDEAQAALSSWLEEVIRPGISLQGSGLRPAADATTIKIRNGELIVTDGPFAETKEQVAGYDVLECPDIDEAVRWASKHPSLFGGAIEIRPLLDSPPPMPLPEPKEGKRRYVLLVCLGEDFQMGPQDQAGMGPATDAWVNEMDARGARVFGSQLEGP